MTIEDVHEASNYYLQKHIEHIEKCINMSFDSFGIEKTEENYKKINKNTYTGFDEYVI